MADLARLATELLAFEVKAGTRVLLLVDTSLAPASRTLRLLREAAPSLPAIGMLKMCTLGYLFITPLAVPALGSCTSSGPLGGAPARRLQ